MTKQEHKASLLTRAVEKLFVGTRTEQPFIYRHIYGMIWLGLAALIALCVAVGLWLPQTDWGRPVLLWGGIGAGLVTVLLSAHMFIDLRRATRGPLPALDRTPRIARVVFNGDDGESHALLVRYRGVDGHKHTAQLADLPSEDWIDRFTPGSTWQVYAFQHPDLADTVVFLAEAHDDVWRAGYVLDRIRLGTERGPLKPAPGSPFLREDSTWRFAT